MACRPQVRTSLVESLRWVFGSIALLMCLGILPLGILPRAAAEIRSAAVISTAVTASQPLSGSAQAAEPRLPFYETWYFFLALLFIGMLLPVQIFRRRMQWSSTH